AAQCRMRDSTTVPGKGLGTMKDDQLVWLVVAVVALLLTIVMPTEAGAQEPTLAACNWAFQEEPEQDAEQVRRCIVALISEVQYTPGAKGRGYVRVSNGWKS